MSRIRYLPEASGVGETIKPEGDCLDLRNLGGLHADPFRYPWLQRLGSCQSKALTRGHLLFLHGSQLFHEPNP